MKRFLQWHLLSLALVLGPSPVPAATTASGLPLGEVLTSALQRQQDDSSPSPYQSSAWLAGLPSLELVYLKSDENRGTDETEIGLNLPVKSPYQQEQDKRLQALAASLDANEQDRRRLYYSGLIREAVWTLRLARTRESLAAEKVTLLESLLARQQALLEAGSSPRNALLLIRQELLDARLAQQEQAMESARWQQRFRQLTGLGSVPGGIDEPPVPAGRDWQGNPELRRLDLDWQQQQALIAAGSERSAPFNVRVGAKNLDSPEFEETQYGLSVEIPLGFFATASQSSRSEWQQAVRAHWRARDELQLALAQSWQQLQGTARHLQKRQALLEEAAAISAELVADSQSLLRLNELGQQVWVSRFISDLDRQAEVVINQLLIGQNRAMSRQAAGIPL